MNIFSSQIKRAPLISIACITYNHELFLAEAIESFLMQKTEYSYEIIIHDDASTDNTASILREYAAKYPNLIFPIYQKTNQYSQGINPGFSFVIPACQGKYIAVCEGDDYWTDPFKLQKQVDFMEENPDFTLCYHNAIIKHDGEKGKDEYFINNSINETTDITKVINGEDSIPTASMLFRWAALEIPLWLKYVYNGDLALQLILANRGKFHYSEETMSVYRKQPGGLHATVQSEAIWRHKIKLMVYFNFYTNFKYHELIDRRINVLFDQYNIILTRKKTKMQKLFSMSFWNRRIGKLFFNDKHSNLKFNTELK